MDSFGCFDTGVSAPRASDTYNDNMCKAKGQRTPQSAFLTPNSRIQGTHIAKPNQSTSANLPKGGRTTLKTALSLPLSSAWRDGCWD